jgi:hypothetical protein
MDTSLEVLKRFLDKTFPDVGMDCPIFPVMVVLFSAAMMRNANPAFLEQFTRYRREFIDGIAANMANNGLWKDDRYLACGWLDEGHFDEEEFGQQVDVAMGTLWYTEQAVRRGRVDVLWIRPEIQPQREGQVRCRMKSSK